MVALHDIDAVPHDAVRGERRDDRARRRRQVEDGDARTGARQGAGVLLPEATRAAGDDGRFTAEIEELLDDGAA